MLKNIIIKVSVILSAIIGVVLQMDTASGGFMSGRSLIMYFTIQSNLWIAMIAFVGIFVAIFNKPAKGFYLLKYILTMGILLTYVVFSILLSPSMPLSYLVSPSNLFVHTLTPVLAMVDYLMNDHKITVNKQGLYGLITPAYYLVFSYTMYFAGIRFSDGSKFPYFFLDFESNGWFTFNDGKLGVVFWYLIVMGLIYLISEVASNIKRRNRQDAPIMVAVGMVLLTLIVTAIRLF